MDADQGSGTNSFLLDDECPEDFERLREGWLAHYESQAFDSLIERVIRADWLLHRAERQSGGRPADEEYRRLLREKTRAEVSFYRALRAMEQFRKRQAESQAKTQKANKGGCSGRAGYPIWKAVSVPEQSEADAKAADSRSMG